MQIVLIGLLANKPTCKVILLVELVTNQIAMLFKKKILCKNLTKNTFKACKNMITPSFNSNQAYFSKFVKPENVFYPDKDSISSVISRVDKDRDEWEQYLGKKKEYEKFQNSMNNNVFIPDTTLLYWHDMGFLHQQKPEWKYRHEVPPRSCLIMDDCLSSPALLQSSGLTKIATLNRHISPLKQIHSNRSACGLAVIILSQTYRMQGGLGRCLRENLSLLTLFKNRQQKQMDAIQEELANVVDEDKFKVAYEYATGEKYGSLTVDFNPKCNTKVFRKNLNEAIIFDDMECQCKK